MYYDGSELVAVDAAGDEIIVPGSTINQFVRSTQRLTSWQCDNLKDQQVKLQLAGQVKHVKQLSVAYENVLPSH